MTNGTKEQRDAAIAKALLPEFDYVCRIDAETGKHIIYYSANEKTLVPENSTKHYDIVMEKFNRWHVIPEERDRLVENMKLDHVKKMLAAQED